MKGLLTLIALCFAFSAWSDVTYPVKNFKYISDSDFRDEVQNSDKYVVMVFSSKSCLERINIDRSCFMFEKKLDYFVPSFSANVKVVAFNTFFENYNIMSQFQVFKIPSVILLKDNQILKRFEPAYDQTDGRLDWQDDLLKEVLNTVYQIH